MKMGVSQAAMMPFRFVDSKPITLLLHEPRREREPKGPLASKTLPNSPLLAQ